MDSDELKNQAQYIWNRLDDLAATDPDAYKNFIDQQMKEREVYNSSPEPKMCFMTHLKEDFSVDVYINLCAWQRIPYPSNDTEPVKLMCGFKKSCSGHDGRKVMIIPVATNDKVVDEIMKVPADKAELIKLIIKFITHEQKIALATTYHICRELFKGDLPANPKRLFVSNPDTEFSEASLRNLLKNGKPPSDILSSPETLIQNLTTEDASEATNNTEKDTDYIKTLTDSSKNQQKSLIEEVEKGVQIPDFSMSEEKMNEQRDSHILLQIKLPRVRSTAECDLTISKEGVELLVPNLYALKIPLQKPVDDEATTAKFNKKTACLTLTMPVLKKGT